MISHLPFFNLALSLAFALSQSVSSIVGTSRKTRRAGASASARLMRDGPEPTLHTTFRDSALAASSLSPLASGKLCS